MFYGTGPSSALIHSKGLYQHLYFTAETNVIKLNCCVVSLLAEWTAANFCKQGTKMRHLGCMSADVYCQITNNFYLRNNIILYSNGKKGKRASCRRDRERVCERQRVAENGVNVHSKNGCWKKD